MNSNGISRQPLRVLILGLFVITNFSSCPGPFRSGGNEKNGPQLNEPKYQKKVVWSKDLRCLSVKSDPLIEGNICYFPASSVPENKQYYSRIIKLDLNTGQTIWETGLIPSRYIDSPVKVGNKIYVTLNTGDIMLVFSGDDGSHAATVRFGATAQEARDYGERNLHTAVHGNLLIWGTVAPHNNATTSYAIMSFDTTQIDFTKAPQDVQIFIPEPLWGNERKDGVYTFPRVDNGILYFLTMDHTVWGDPTWTSLLTALDIATKTIVWQREVSHMNGGMWVSLIINEEKLYVVDMGPSCYNKYTGEPYYEKGWPADITSEPFLYISNYTCGITLHNNRLYYTNGITPLAAQSHPGTKYFENILCVDGNTGNLIWGAINPNSCTLTTYPVVHNGKAFIVTENGLRVYDADNGKLLGVDKSVKSAFATDHGYIYGDYYIFVHDNDTTKLFTAIKAE
jgi:hypothetical protein